MNRDKDIEFLKIQLEHLRQFNYIVAHDLKSPIRNITSLIHLLETEHPEGGDIIYHIKKQGELLSRCLENVTYLIESPSGFQSEYEPIDLNQVLDETSKILSSAFDSAIYTIGAEFNHSYSVKGIKTFFISIFLNLLSNSIKYKKPGQKAEINIRSSDLEESVQLTFQDNGLGFDSSEGDVFEIYSRKNDDFEVEGSGLGLHLVKSQVEIMGGKVIAESVKGKGTTVTIVFPH